MRKKHITLVFMPVQEDNLIYTGEQGKLSHFLNISRGMLIFKSQSLYRFLAIKSYWILFPIVTAQD